MSSMTQKARMNNCGDLLVVSKRDPNLTFGIKYTYLPSQNSRMGFYKTGTVPLGCCMVPSD